MENIIKLKHLKDEVIEKNGKFQIVLIILLAFNSISVGINHTLTSFHVYKPKYFCRNDETLTCSTTKFNGTLCQDGYVFDVNDDRTLAVEYSLVCDREFIGSLINTLYFVGVTIGSLVCTTLSDIYGRKKVVLSCMYIQAIISVGIYFSNTLELFIVLRIVQGIFVQGLQTCSYTLLMEYCPSKWRTAASILWGLNWATGLAVLGSVSYFVREWRHLTLVLITPTVISLIYVWIISESLSWLYANKKYKECFRLIKRIAKVNNDTETLMDCHTLQAEFKHCPANYLEVDTSQKTGQDKGRHIIFDLMQSKVLRKHMTILSSVWFFVTVCYYKLLYFLPNLSGQRHLNFLMGAAVEGVSYIIAYFIFARGRRVSVGVYQIVNGVLIITIGALSSMDESSLKNIAITTFALLAKGCSVACFAGMFMYSCELFPTVCRGVALGLCAFCSRTACLITPQFMLLLNFIPTYAFMSITGVCVILTGISTFWLPETLTISLPHTIDDAEKIYKTKTCKSRNDRS